MKRSEMLLKIREMMASREDIQTLADGAEALLNCVEKLGMLPPYKTKDRQYPDSLLTHTWEPEKEEE